ncbi:MAG: 3-oxoacyl-ACP reductase FabG [Oxalobacter sp.]|nr:3-oxoacyl-ACP reductase FabG [Oxalobacter sp.]
MKEQNLAGKVAFVTGASRGIGWAIAMELASRGAIVVGTALDESSAQEITKALNAVREGAGKGVVLDVRDSDACRQTIDAIQKEFGALHILVNNAGITQDQLAMRMKDEDWANVLSINLTAVAALSRMVLRGMMRAKEGRIISISSVVGSIGNPGQTNYAAAKAGVEGMSRALAREVGSRNITVNCVAPGFIDTNMTRVLPEEVKENLVKQIPLARLGSPEDIAAAVAFLASPQAAYITGSVLHVNGGMFMN